MKWTNEMRNLAETVANGALLEVGFEPTAYCRDNGEFIFHLPLSEAEDEAQDRAGALGIAMVERRYGVTW